MPPVRIRNTFSLWCLLLTVLSPLTSNAAKHWFNAESHKINDQISSIQYQLDQLPKTSPTGIPSTLGYQSGPLESKEEEVTIEVHFRTKAAIDLVVLAPAVYEKNGITLTTLGFPERFLLERILPDRSTETIADHREVEYKRYGIEPQLFYCPDPKPCIGIKITATKNSDDLVFAMSELFAFAGDFNAALNGVVTVPHKRWVANAWQIKSLVDGYTYYSPIDRSKTFPHSFFRSNTQQAELIFDFKRQQTIDELRLWPLLPDFYFTHSFDSGFGFPTELLFESLKSPDDPHPSIIYATKNLPRPGATPFMQRLPRTHTRYLRVTLKNGFHKPRASLKKMILLNEIEFFHNGTNVVQGISPDVKMYKNQSNSPDLKCLTNGRAGRGQIIPLRQWLIDYVQQEKLKRQLNTLQDQLRFILQQEQQRVTSLAGVAIGLAVILALMIWVVRLMDMRHWAIMRDQIACDLHDEVGANLSGIAHSTELLSELIPSPTEMQKKLLSSTIRAAQMTARDTRQFIKILHKKKSRISFEAQLRNVSAQLLNTIPHQYSLKETETFDQLLPVHQWSLLLFIKEALNNTIKHANATEVQVTTIREGSRIKLTIQDNGCGISPENLPLHQLQRRAKQLKGKMDLQTEPGQGTRITLTLRKPR